jgi:hypothetical protein
LAIVDLSRSRRGKLVDPNLDPFQQALRFATMIIQCSKLTTCRVLVDGKRVSLELLDERSNPISLLLSFEDAESIAMTLPRLLTQAVKAQTGQHNARYTFALGRWLVEAVEDHQSFILTLATIDGFEVAFRIPHATCRALGRALQHDSENDAADLGDPPTGVGKRKTN